MPPSSTLSTNKGEVESPNSNPILLKDNPERYAEHQSWRLKQMMSMLTYNPYRDPNFNGSYEPYLEKISGNNLEDILRIIYFKKSYPLPEGVIPSVPVSKTKLDELDTQQETKSETPHSSDDSKMFQPHRTMDNEGARDLPEGTMPSVPVSPTKCDELDTQQETKLQYHIVQIHRTMDNEGARDLPRTYGPRTHIDTLNDSDSVDCDSTEGRSISIETEHKSDVADVKNLKNEKSDVPVKTIAYLFKSCAGILGGTSSIIKPVNYYRKTDKATHTDTEKLNGIHICP